MSHAIEQALRISHCSNTGKEHACVGTCKITPNGIELECAKCGSDAHKEYDPNQWLEDRAVAIFRRAGMDFSLLTDGAKASVLQEISKDFCPNCKRLHIHTRRFPDYAICACGWTWGAGRGWKAPQPNTPTVCGGAA